MRIAMIGSRGIPARSGGVERVVEELAVALEARGHEVLVYGRGGYVAGAPAPRAGRLIVTPGLGGKHLETITHTATAMMDVLRRNVDVVHVHSPGPALLSWIPAMAGRPVVLTIHAPDWRRDKWSAPARLAIDRGLRCGMRYAAAVTAVSRPLRDELQRTFGRQVHFVPNAVAPAQPQPARQILQWGLQPDGYGLYVGRIVPEKRLDLLIRAWQLAKTSLPLVVVGEDSEKSYARACRREAPENILFLGPRYGEELAELYSHAALVVQPSALEGFSLVLLEAAEYGRCILAADIPANRENLAESVLYFSVDDASELAFQIGRCIKDGRFRQEAGQAARRYVRSHFSWSASAGLMEEIYREVCR